MTDGSSNRPGVPDPEQAAPAKVAAFPMLALRHLRDWDPGPDEIAELLDEIARAAAESAADAAGMARFRDDVIRIACDGGLGRVIEAMRTLYDALALGCGPGAQEEAQAEASRELLRGVVRAIEKGCARWKRRTQHKPIACPPDLTVRVASAYAYLMGRAERVRDERERREAEVRRQVAELPENLRTVLELHVYQRMTLEETAASMKREYGAVKRFWITAQAELARKLGNLPN